MAAPVAATAGQFLMSLLSDIVANKVAGPASAAAGPSQYDVAESAVSKPYFQGAAPELAYTQYYANEAFKRNFLRGLGFDVPELESPDVFMGGVEERLDQIAFLKQLLGNPAAEGGPWSGTDDEPQRNWTEAEAEPPNPTRAIWAGDFNMEPGSAEYRALLGQTPYPPGARYADGLIDPAAGLGLHTHVKEIASETRLRQLDHVFLTPDLAPHVARVWADTTNPASDPFPLHIDLTL
jgi:hypothetical protein